MNSRAEEALTAWQNDLLTLTLTSGKNKSLYPSVVPAENLGCFLPFPYTDEVKVFDYLPTFFAQRMVSSDFQRYTFDIDIPKERTMEVLTFLNSKKNNDNFLIVDADLIKIPGDDQELKKTP